MSSRRAAISIAHHPEVIAQWKKLGLENIFIGFEKPSQKGLESVNKHNSVENNDKSVSVLRAYGLEPVTSFIVNPDYTHEDFEVLKQYVRKLKLQQPSFSILTPLPGTPLYDDLKDDLIVRDYERWDLAHCVLPTTLPLQEFYREFTGLYRAAYPLWKLMFGDLALRMIGMRGKKEDALQARRLIRQVRQLRNPQYYLQ